jgi:hypothetical protein
VDSGSGSGGILKLRELIEEHPAELAYDFRHRFALSVFDIGHTVTWQEAIFLVAMLYREPSSWLQTAVNGWKYPVSLEWMMARHTYDLIANANFKKPKPFPTPWPDQNEKKLGGNQPQTRAEVLRKLALMNPEENDG